MTQNANPMPRIPLGVLVAAAPDAAAGSGLAAGKKYRPGADHLLETIDDRFSLQVLAVDNATIAVILEQHPHWCGVLLDEGLRRTEGDTGWAAALNIDDAVLPVEFVGHLRDDEQAGESFVARVLTCSAWRDLQASAPTVATLQAFFAQHKYLLMSRHIASYQMVGQWLANPATQSLDALARQVITAIMAALRRPATRGGHGNALAHVRGYLKNRLSVAEQAALDEALEWYRLGLVPVRTPLDLLREYFERYPHPYIEQQVYMLPRLHARFDVVALLDELRGGGLRHSAGER